MKPKQKASGINPRNLQEMLGSASNALAGGQRQWFTPPEYAQVFAIPLAELKPSAVCDLQAGCGNLLAPIRCEHKLALDIDGDFRRKPKGVGQEWHPITGDLTLVADLLDEASWKCDLFTLNPPFGLKWEKERLAFLAESKVEAVRDAWAEPGKALDSTLATLMLALHFCTTRGEGYLIANESSMDRLLGAPGAAAESPLRDHVWMWLSLPGTIFTGTDPALRVCVLYFAADHKLPGRPPHHVQASGTGWMELGNLLQAEAESRWEHRGGISLTSPGYAINSAVSRWQAVDHEWRARTGDKPEYNIWLRGDGRIGRYLSTFQTVSGRIPRSLVESLDSLDGQYPSSLVVQKATREALLSAVNGGVWRVDPALPPAIDKAITDYNSVRAPFYPLSEAQRIGYLDESSEIVCQREGLPGFQKGQRYALASETVPILRNAQSMNYSGQWDELEITGEDLLITITSGTGQDWLFMPQPDMLASEKKDRKQLHDLQMLLDYFAIPEVPDIASLRPEEFRAALASIRQIEAQASLLTGKRIAAKTYQRDDIARASLHSGALLAWAAGLGKTFGAILYGLLVKSRVNLIVAPENLHRRFIREGAEKFGITILPLMSQQDFATDEALQAEAMRLLQGRPAGEQPVIWRITSYTALGYNGGDEWTQRFDAQDQPLLNRDRMARREALPGWLPEHAGGIGEVHDGIKCVLFPTLSTLIGGLFGYVAVDEGVRMQASDAYIAQGVRNMNPARRLVLSATPIKNRLESIFWLAWWACGGSEEPTARFPYEASDEARERFANEHQLQERNLSREERAKTAGRRNARCVRRTPEICNIHRLWKLFGPIIVRRRKEDCGEDIVPKAVIPLRVKPCAAQQAVYRYHLENPPQMSRAGRVLDKPFMQIGAQLAILRQAALCPDDPSLRDYGGGSRAASWTPWNTKVAAALSLVIERIALGEQIILMSPFQHATATIHKMLLEAGVSSCLLDGNVTATRRGKLSEMFERFHFSTMCAGQKAMGEGNSFEQCPNLVRLSLDWSFDINDQAGDRVHRVNSPKPVRIYDFLTENTIDERIWNLYRQKADSSNLALDGRLFAEHTQEVNLAQLLYEAIESFDPSAETVTEESLEAEWPQVQAKLRTAERMFREFHPPILDVSRERGHERQTTLAELNIALLGLRQPSALTHRRNNPRRAPRFTGTANDALAELLDSLDDRPAPSHDELLDSLHDRKPRP